MISQLGKYEIRRELGRGAMGVVYEAFDPMIKRRVALKTIRPDQLAGGRPDDVIARFRREAQAAGRLSHPNIVSIYDFDEDNGTWFIAMEYVDGRELKDCFAADERFRTADVERIMAQILAALDYSHRQGVVHRDIKPANIFLLADGTVKVADFGIAHIEASSLTQVGTVVGTPNYMSPEQIMGLPVDGRSDIFSAGVILYQFLTGERPFAGSSTTTMQKVLKEEPLPPSTLNVQLPPAIDSVVRKALAKRAVDRFATAQAFADALRAALPTQATGTHAAVLSSDVDATLPNVTAIVPPQPAARSQATSLAIVAAVSLIGLCALVASWWLWPRNETAGQAQRTSTTVAASSREVGRAASTPPHRTSDATAPTSAAPAAAPSGATDAAPPSATQPPAANASAAPLPASAAAALEVPNRAPGTLTISAVGLVDPSDPQYGNDPARMQSAARSDSRQQLVEKAVVMLLDRQSFAANYDVLRSRVVAQSGTYIHAITREGEPQLGKNGLVSVTTQGVVDVKAIQQSLNRLSREERVDLIRAGGDPRISLQIAVRDADRSDVGPRASPIAENVVKERIKSFGFRTWSDDMATGGQAPDFTVSGEAAIRKLSTRLEASGLVITKYALASWTVKCTDRVTGEEIYFNTTLPKGLGSYASESEALRALGASVGDQFSREFFLQHISVKGRTVTLNVNGMPDAASEDLLARELMGLPTVMGVKAGPATKPRTYELQVAGDATSDAIARDIVAPLNAKLGEACFSVGPLEGTRMEISVTPHCASGTLRGKLESNPPAALYGAPPARQKAVIKNPETLRKLV